MAPEAVIDPSPGADQRIVFTYGREREDVGIPIGSTTEIYTSLFVGSVRCV